jgi:hypothetical protein
MLLTQEDWTALANEALRAGVHFMFRLTITQEAIGRGGSIDVEKLAIAEMRLHLKRMGEYVTTVEEELERRVSPRI